MRDYLNIEFSHFNFNNINELVKKDLVGGLSNAQYTLDRLCDAC